MARSSADIVKDWKVRLQARLELERNARAEHMRGATAKTRAKLMLRRAQVAQARRVIARHSPLSEIVGLDGCPVPRGLALALLDARKNGWSGELVSGDRRQGVAERYGKSSQAKLYDGWRRRLPGYNPANPPGFSTHERRHDGSGSLSSLSRAYERARGHLLAWWQTGLDVTEAAELVGVLNRLGYSAKRPYNSKAEAHHVNFVRSPSARLKQRKIR